MEAAVRRYLRWMRTNHYSARTVEEREIFLATFLKWCEAEGIGGPAEVTPALLERYRAHLADYRTRSGRKLKSQSQAIWLVSVRGFFRYLARTGQILSNPASELTLPRARRRLPRHLNEADAERVLNLPDITTPLGLRDRAILELLYSTGIRRAELAALKPGDLDAAGGLLRVRPGKGGHDRTVPVGGRAVSWILRYAEDARPQLGGGALFLTNQGKPFTANRLTGLVREYVAAAGLKGSCHLFRHTMATLMHENGADVRHLQQILGHARLSSTAIYTHTAIPQLKATHRRTHPGERHA